MAGYENLIETITLLSKGIGSTDCALAVDDLCHNLLADQIKKIKPDISRTLANGLDQFYAQYAQKLLQTYAKKLRPDRLRLERLYTRIEAFLVDAQPSLDLAVDIFRLKEQINQALLFFTERLWFLPDRSAKQKLDRWIYHSFKKWYTDDPLDARLRLQLSKLDQLSLAIPSLEFRQLFPTNPPIVEGQVFECSLCNGEDPRRVRFCESCSAENTICYSCFYQNAWAHQHDEHRVFSEFKSVPCPFCRREYNLGEPFTVFQAKISP